MARELFSASAPGSMMLFGEHAVLRYNQAIVCAIDKRITVTLYPQNSNDIIIRSNAFPELITKIVDLRIQPPYEFVLATILAVKDNLPSGFVVEINSDFSPTVGFGSSAAVTMAMLAVLNKWLGIRNCYNLLSTGEKISGKSFKADTANITDQLTDQIADPITDPITDQLTGQIADQIEDQLTDQQKLLFMAKQVMLAVQGVGSGADLAASVYGGVLHYVREPMAVTSLPTPKIQYLLAVYSGVKLKTKDVLKIVAKEAERFPELYDYIYRAITDCVERAVVAICKSDWELVGKLMSMQHGLMVALGVSNALLDELVWQLRDVGALGAKISGSGLGDCVIGLVGSELIDPEVIGRGVIGPEVIGSKFVAPIHELQKNGVVFPRNAEQRAQGVVQFPLQIARQGVVFENI